MIRTWDHWCWKQLLWQLCHKLRPRWNRVFFLYPKYRYNCPPPPATAILKYRSKLKCSKSNRKFTVKHNYLPILFTILNSGSKLKSWLAHLSSELEVGDGVNKQLPTNSIAKGLKAACAVPRKYRTKHENKLIAEPNMRTN